MTLADGAEGWLAKIADKQVELTKNLQYLLLEEGRRSPSASDPPPRWLLLCWEDEPPELWPEGRFHFDPLSRSLLLFCDDGPPELLEKGCFQLILLFLFKIAAFLVGPAVGIGVGCG